VNRTETVLYQVVVCRAVLSAVADDLPGEGEVEWNEKEKEKEVGRKERGEEVRK